jgi:hypothetical protein
VPVSPRSPADPSGVFPLSPAWYATARSSPDNEDDDLLAAILVNMWTLASGRSLPPGVRPEQLSKDELIDFWADDLDTAAPGRHAAMAGGAA